jgi:hypothetical protein
MQYILMDYVQEDSWTKLTKAEQEHSARRRSGISASAAAASNPSARSD